MKRFHVHLHVDDLAKSVAFHSQLFALEPARREADYAEGATTCCYARSEKHWITDPQGIAWEHFHSLGGIPVFNETERDAAAACCAGPGHARETVAAACCAPPRADARPETCC